MKIEYLLIFERENFAKSVEKFKSLIDSSDFLKIIDNKLNFTQKDINETVEVNFKIDEGEVKLNSKEKFYQIELSSHEDNKLEALTKVSKELRRVFHKVNENKKKIRIIKLSNDVEFNYSIQAYPKIIHIENLMRKLGKKFMGINLGMDWEKTAMKTQSKNKLESRRKESITQKHIIDETDFIELTEIIFFEKYRNINEQKFEKYLQNLKEEDEVDFELLKSYISKSNWERYFSDIVEYEGNRLEKQWKELYGIRNKIAHSKGITKEEFNKVVNITNEIIPPIKKAISKLNLIKIPKEDFQRMILSGFAFMFLIALIVAIFNKEENNKNGERDNNEN